MTVTPFDHQVQPCCIWAFVQDLRPCFAEMKVWLGLGWNLLCCFGMSCTLCGENVILSGVMFRVCVCVCMCVCAYVEVGRWAGD